MEDKRPDLVFFPKKEVMTPEIENATMEEVLLRHPIKEIKT
jgi:hypothetical protein